MAKADNSLSSFKNNVIKQFGIASANRYLVELQYNGWTLEMPAEAVTLPGKAFVTIDEQWFGPKRTIPVGSKYDGNVILTFPVADDQGERIFFEEWMNDMVDRWSHLSNYEASYDGWMTIYTLDANGQPTSKYEFLEVYPSYIMPTNIGAAMFNDYMRLQVQFEYRIYHVN